MPFKPNITLTFVKIYIRTKIQYRHTNDLLIHVEGG